jgi:hypothetical protein
MEKKSALTAVLVLALLLPLSTFVILPVYATSFADGQNCTGTGTSPSLTCTFTNAIGKYDRVYVGVTDGNCGSAPATPTFSFSGVTLSSVVSMQNIVVFSGQTCPSIRIGPLTTAQYYFDVWIFTGMETSSGVKSFTCSNCDNVIASDITGLPSIVADKTSTGSSSSGTSLSVSSYSPGATGDFIFGAGSSCGTATYTAGTGMQLAGSSEVSSCTFAGVEGLGAVYQLSSSGSETCPITASVGGFWAEACASFPVGGYATTNSETMTYAESVSTVAVHATITGTETYSQSAGAGIAGVSLSQPMTYAEALNSVGLTITNPLSLLYSESANAGIAAAVSQAMTYAESVSTVAVHATITGTETYSQSAGAGIAGVSLSQPMTYAEALNSVGLTITNPLSLLYSESANAGIAAAVSQALILYSETVGAGIAGVSLSQSETYAESVSSVALTAGESILSSFSQSANAAIAGVSLSQAMSYAQSVSSVGVSAGNSILSTFSQSANSAIAGVTGALSSTYSEAANSGVGVAVSQAMTYAESVSSVALTAGESILSSFAQSANSAITAGLSGAESYLQSVSSVGVSAGNSFLSSFVQSANAGIGAAVSQAMTYAESENGLQTIHLLVVQVVTNVIDPTVVKPVAFLVVVVNLEVKLLQFFLWVLVTVIKDLV